MNSLLLKKFTPEILRGAKSLGFEPASHRRILSTRLAETLEEQTGKTIGELALLGIKADATPIQQKHHRKLVRETMELMTAFDSRPLAGQTVGGSA